MVMSCGVIRWCRVVCHAVSCGVAWCVMWTTSSSRRSVSWFVMWWCHGASCGVMWCVMVKSSRRSAVVTMRVPCGVRQRSAWGGGGTVWSCLEGRSLLGGVCCLRAAVVGVVPTLTRHGGDAGYFSSPSRPPPVSRCAAARAPHGEVVGATDKAEADPAPGAASAHYEGRVRRGAAHYTPFLSLSFEH